VRSDHGPRLRTLIARSLSVLPFTATPLAAETTSSADLGLYYLPNDGDGGTRTVKVHDFVLDLPTRWGLSAQPDAGISFPISKGTATIPPQAILPAVEIDGLAGTKVRITAFCTPKRRSTMGLRNEMWGPLWSKIVTSLSDGRTCLYDQNGDGLAETAFLLDVGTDEDRKPHAIAPVPLHVDKLRESDAGSRVQIQLLKGVRPIFRIRILDGGKPLEFESVSHDATTEPRDQSTPRDAAYPLDWTIFGARLAILAYDRGAGTVTIRYPAADPTPVTVPADITVRYTMRYGG
jgi:hypothetical protein